MGAMQAQEYAMAKWAMGLRIGGLHEDIVEQAFNEGKILRTHLMRPTWHFVSPDNIRWLLKLTAPRVHAVNAFMYRKCELDQSIFRRSNDVLVKSLEGGKHLTRNELKAELEKVNITGDGVRIAYLIMNAELEGLICSGPRQGNQFTYALLDERVPTTKAMNPDESLAKLSSIYFTSRGPAQAQDFAMWSGLTLKDAKDGVKLLPPEFERTVVDSREYFFKTPTSPFPEKAQATFLMPDYDEFGMSYKDRSALSFDIPEVANNKPASFMYNRMIIVDGKLAGSWRRTINNEKVTIETDILITLTKAQKSDVSRAVEKYCAFIGKIAEHSF